MVLREIVLLSWHACVDCIENQSLMWRTINFNNDKF